jgi:phospholipid-binding lipoprotein MlaA
MAKDWQVMYDHKPRSMPLTKPATRFSACVILLLAGLLNACASNAAAQNYSNDNILADDEVTVVASKEAYYDPLISVNRAVFAFNNISYRYVLIPTAKAYKAVTPDPVEVHVGMFFENLKAPISIVNHLLQWEPSKAGRMTGRFLVNSTVGLLGLFDPAEAWLEIEAQPTGFSDTLRQYGSGRGPYLVLPFLGPSDLRGGAGVVGDYLANPVPYLTEQPDTSLIMSADTLQSFSGRADIYKKLYDSSSDPYLFFRNMYLQGQQRDEFYNSNDIFVGSGEIGTDK